jgi:uncharacterized protein (DUF983 family)
MFKKGTRFYSIFTGACPKCHQESMYSNKNPYYMPDVLKINARCSHCDTKYRLEPSFFYGAMYVSYGVGIAFAVAAYIISNIFLHASLLMTFGSIVVTLIAFMPIIMRLSRNIWINIFIHFDKTKVEK